MSERVRERAWEKKANPTQPWSTNSTQDISLDHLLAKPVAYCVCACDFDCCSSFGFVFGLLHTRSCSLFLFSTNLGSDRSCQQQRQQHHTADKKTTAWRRYCYYRCLPAAGIAHTLFYPWFISFPLCFVCFEHWPRSISSSSSLLALWCVRENERSWETDRTTRRREDVCFDACLSDFFAFIQICFLWFGQFDAFDSSSPSCLSIHSCLVFQQPKQRGLFWG